MNLSGVVVRASWAYANDCFFSSLCIKVSPEVLACSCLCISICQQKYEAETTGSVDTEVWLQRIHDNKLDIDWKIFGIDEKILTATVRSILEIKQGYSQDVNI